MLAKLVATLSLCTLPISAMAADRLKVSLAANGDATTNAESCLRSGLASLRDVEIVDANDADVVVRVTVLEQETGVALAMLVLTPFDNGFITTAAQDKYRKTVGGLTSGLFYSPELYLRSGAASELQRVCKDAIAQLDRGLLDDIRKTRREIEEALRSYKPAGKN